MNTSTRRRRDRYDIFAEILEAARDGTLRTHLMARASLCSRQVSEYVDLLLDKGFLENVGKIENGRFRHVLKTTRKGKEFLESLTTLYMLLLPRQRTQPQWLQNAEILVYKQGTQ